ncbi:metallophosphatase domain-containing protein [Thioflexithrix psekupsensis]|uniref:Calcineurin-like phosphoesterase domain-containing protein n=1 Tax=Thioflexithrix psekupsensis TaxID=1570016 RepID=A0A251XCA0_9GAMM|nr:metallophosphatase domain-containing protein [Thioflexithrix psekupsensis]OUD16223.1 hypothetical protein TPSD3_00410 [Thioflexithrix psekupsensis]
MKIVVISDTHSQHHALNIPDADILIHAGDFSWGKKDLSDVIDFNSFLEKLPHRHKLVVAGNHDFAFARTPKKARECLSAAIYLQDNLVEIDGLKIYGSPWQPAFLNGAFNLEIIEDLAEKWAAIPSGIDILITHTPPYGIGDIIRSGKHVGCRALSKAIDRIVPKYHIFGHIHESFGTTQLKDTTFINASICDVFGNPCQPIVSFEL